MVSHRWWLGALCCLVSACRDRAPQPPVAVHTDSSAPRPDTAVRADSGPPIPATPPRRSFRPYALRGASDLQLLIDSLGPAGVTTILKLNRIDLARARAGDTLLVPEAIEDELAFAPFPASVSALDSVPRLIAVSQRVQAFGAYEHGKLVRWGPTSTGKAKTPTPNGLYFTTWKRKQTVSTDNDEWLLKWYFNFENARGISFHEYDLPGYPASHACVRLLADDAEWIYSWARQWRLSGDAKSIVAYGTPVAVFGTFEYARPRPWRRVVDSVEAATIPPAELDSMLAHHLPLIRARARPDST